METDPTFDQRGRVSRYPSETGIIKQPMQRWKFPPVSVLQPPVADKSSADRINSWMLDACWIGEKRASFLPETYHNSHGPKGRKGGVFCLGSNRFRWIFNSRSPINGVLGGILEEKLSFFFSLFFFFVSFKREVYLFCEIVTILL